VRHKKGQVGQQWFPYSTDGMINEFCIGDNTTVEVEDIKVCMTKVHRKAARCQGDAEMKRHINEICANIQQSHQ
jgi:hypothetical protein